MKCMSMGTLKVKNMTLIKSRVVVVDVNFLPSLATTCIFFDLAFWALSNLITMMTFPVMTTKKGIKSPRQASIHVYGPLRNHSHDFRVSQSRVTIVVFPTTSFFSIMSELKKKWMLITKRIRAITNQVATMRFLLQSCLHLSGIVTEMVLSDVRRMSVHDASWWE